ncbi:MAG: hypothetical protein D6744_14225, partial [Planctomycetota bacterium]
MQSGLLVTAAAGMLAIAGCPLFPPSTPTGDAVSGETIWNADNCLTCHGQMGCGASGPDIRSVTFEEVDAELRSADTSHVGGSRTELSDQQVADLVAYLNSITDDDCTLTAADAPSKVANFALIPIHDPASDGYNSNCTSCNGDRAMEGALDGSIPAFHSVMPGLLGSDSDRCLTCHSEG